MINFPLNLRRTATLLLLFVLFGALPPQAHATKEEAKATLLGTILLLKQGQLKIKERREYRTGAIKEGYERTITDTFQGGTRYVILAVGCVGVSDIDLKLYNASGTLVAKDVKDNKVPAVNFTPPADGTYTVKIQMLKTSGAEQVGHFAYQVFYVIT